MNHACQSAPPEHSPHPTKPLRPDGLAPTSGIHHYSITKSPNPGLRFAQILWHQAYARGFDVLMFFSGYSLNGAMSSSYLYCFGQFSFCANSELNDYFFFFFLSFFLLILIIAATITPIAPIIAPIIIPIFGLLLDSDS